MKLPDVTEKTLENVAGLCGAVLMLGGTVFLVALILFLIAGMIGVVIQ